MGWVDSAQEKDHALQIPSALSWLTYRDLTSPVTGLDQIPKEEWPNVPVVFQTYHIMIWMWVLMLTIALLGLWRWRTGTLARSRGLLWAMVFSVGFPHIAQQCGWICAEMGRQPWIVWKLLRASDGVSTVIRSGQVMGSIVMFIVIYLLLFALFLFLLDRKIKQGPEALHNAGDQIYRDIAAK